MFVENIEINQDVTVRYNSPLWYWAAFCATIAIGLHEFSGQSWAMSALGGLLSFLAPTFVYIILRALIYVLDGMLWLLSKKESK